MLERISRLIKSKKLSSSQFADAIGVQRSSVSHVMSGRNKPSLDFVTKILDVYDDINPDWLLTGNGNMFRDAQETAPGMLPFVESEASDSDLQVTKTETKVEKPPVKREEIKKTGTKRMDTGQKSIEKIVLFYVDGTFREFSPEEY